MAEQPEAIKAVPVRHPWRWVAAALILLIIANGIWSLATEAQIVSTSTLSKMVSILRRTIQRQMARDRVKRNVALLCELPKGQSGRPSKSMTLEQAKALLRRDARCGSPSAVSRR